MKKKQIENMRTDCYEKKFQIGNQECKVRIEDAYYGEWNGKTEILDEKVIDSMCKEMLAIVAKHSIKYNPIPSCITLLHNLESSNNIVENNEILFAIEPRYKLEQVALPQETREQLEITLSAVRNRERLNME